MYFVPLFVEELKDICLFVLKKKVTPHNLLKRIKFCYAYNTFLTGGGENGPPVMEKRKLFINFVSELSLNIFEAVQKFYK